MSTSWMKDLRLNLVFAFCLRLGLVVYGLWQDSVMAVKYTDIDYIVFTDAARYMSQDLSPYRRATYRYTPILAWILQGNLYTYDLFGKIFFAVCDVIVGYLIYRYVDIRENHRTQMAMVCAQLWLFNPLPMTVSTRGNAESVMAILVLSTISLLADGRRLSVLLGGLVYGLAVHTKIYPATYALIFYMYLNGRTDGKRLSCKPADWFTCLRRLLPTRSSTMFAAVAFLAFSSVTAACYHRYGHEFLENTYLYHVTRRDIKHNFSPYFYLLYLMSDNPGPISLILFLPQVLLMFAIALRYHHDVEFACFLQTFIFVTFNKVCTSQYFLWYLCLLPLIIPRLKIKQLLEPAVLFVMWMAGQGLWLLPAYLLEFQGYNVYIYVWTGGLVFFLVNTCVLYRLMMLYSPKVDGVASNDEFADAKKLD